jgi:hypothetical protein
MLFKTAARSLPKVLPFTITITAAFVLMGFARASENPLKDKEMLLDTYTRIEARLAKKSFDFPLYLESADQGGKVNADVYGIIDHPFGNVYEMLSMPANVCDIANLHSEVKACTYRELPDGARLTIYVGRKPDQPVEEADPFTYSYQDLQALPGYMSFVLTAEKGPFGTKNHTMRFKALSLDSGRTFVQISYSYRSPAFRLFEKLYFATFGRGKVGFTVTGTDENGNPVYVGGARGSIERCAVLYFFGIKAFMNTSRCSGDRRFSGLISEWYDLTNRFRRQLFEMEKKDYIVLKTEERKKQIMLQQRFTTNLP